MSLRLDTDTLAAGVAPGLTAVAAAITGLVLFHLSAPDYLSHRGFPLDDAWIHAVYAREIARTLTMAYNPGVPATGETAPLWPILLAPIHRFGGSVGSVVAATKLAGFAMHAAASVILALALAPLRRERLLLACAIAGLVAFHPHLIAASVSGMEVPLAELVIAAVFWATVTRRRAALLFLGAAAIGARPEVAAIAVLLPFLFWISVDRREAVRGASLALGGGVLALAVLGVRNWTISGLTLPATFYVKANRTSPFSSTVQRVGFVDLLGHIPILDSVLVLLIVTIIAVVLFVRPRPGADDADVRAGVALYLSGVAFCAISFALIPPADPPAFYHQRYVLPGVMAAIAAIPLLSHGLLQRLVPRAAQAATIVLVLAFGVVCAVGAPGRARRLSNDAQNIDDVQVAFGMALAAQPQTRTVWAVDAGAIRFFGRPFVVDMIGLNSPELLRADAQHYLDVRPPAFLDVFPGWSRLETDVPARMPARMFETRTAYTVTSSQSMRTHVLVTCEPPGLRGRFVVRGRGWRFQCSL